jgi:hypothetical protein
MIMNLPVSNSRRATGGCVSRSPEDKIIGNIHMKHTEFHDITTLKFKKNHTKHLRVLPNTFVLSKR